MEIYGMSTKPTRSFLPARILLPGLFETEETYPPGFVSLHCISPQYGVTILETMSKIILAHAMDVHSTKTENSRIIEDPKSQVEFSLKFPGEPALYRTGMEDRTVNEGL